MAKKTARRKRGTVVDFTGIQAGGLSIPDGRYAAKIVEWEEKEGAESGEPYVQLTWEITSEKCNGRNVNFDNHSLQPQALPFLRTVLEALEYEIEEGPNFEILWDDLIKDETECIIETVAVPSREDPSKKYARITGFFPLSDGDTVDDEKEDPKRTRGGTTSGKNSKRNAGSEDEDDEPPQRRGRREEDDDDDDEPQRRRKPKDEEEDDDEPPSNKKIKKGARVKFKNDKGKPAKGTIEKINGDMAIVNDDADDESSYEIPTDELTVIG